MSNKLVSTASAASHYHSHQLEELAAAHTAELLFAAEQTAKHEVVFYLGFSSAAYSASTTPFFAPPKPANWYTTRHTS